MKTRLAALLPATAALIGAGFLPIFAAVASPVANASATNPVLKIGINKRAIVRRDVWAQGGSSPELC